jgi:hypothetical protein
MADCIFTTSNLTPEADRSFAQTSVTIRFVAVMRDLSAYIEAERDLEHCDSRDPACDAWIVEAERARAQILNSISLLCVAPVQRREDIPLRHFGALTRLLIESDTPDTFARTMALSMQLAKFFMCSGTGPTARRVNLMIAAFRRQLRDLATLADFAPVGAADYAEIDAEDTNALMAPAA